MALLPGGFIDLFYLGFGEDEDELPLSASPPAVVQRLPEPFSVRSRSPLRIGDDEGVVVLLGARVERTPPIKTISKRHPMPLYSARNPRPGHREPKVLAPPANSVKLPRSFNDFDDKTLTLIIQHVLWLTKVNKRMRLLTVPLIFAQVQYYSSTAGKRGYEESHVMRFVECFAHNELLQAAVKKLEFRPSLPRSGKNCFTSNHRLISHWRGFSRLSMLNIIIPEDFSIGLIDDLEASKNGIFASVRTLQTGLNNCRLDAVLIKHCPGLQHMVMCMAVPEVMEADDDAQSSESDTDSSYSVFENGFDADISNGRDDPNSVVSSIDLDDFYKPLYKGFEIRMAAAPVLKSLYIKSFDLAVTAKLLSFILARQPKLIRLRLSSGVVISINVLRQQLASATSLQQLHLPGPEHIYAPDNGLEHLVALRKPDFFVFAQVVALRIAGACHSLQSITYDKDVQDDDDEPEPRALSRTLWFQNDRERKYGQDQKFGWKDLNNEDRKEFREMSFGRIKSNCITTQTVGTWVRTKTGKLCLESIGLGMEVKRMERTEAQRLKWDAYHDT